MTTGTIGYHVRVLVNYTPLITIHAPTENWQHRPRDQAPKDSFWVGPALTEEGIVRVAKRLAEEYGYPIRYCQLCFRDRIPLPPTSGDQPAGDTRAQKRRREYTPPDTSTKRHSRRGV